MVCLSGQHGGYTRRMNDLHYGRDAIQLTCVRQL